MRRGCIGTLIATLFLSLSTPALALEHGDLAPAVKLSSRDGGTIDLRSLKGKIVYVDFWASWCAPCRVALPWLEELKSTLPGDRFQVIAVNMDSDPALRDEVLGAIRPSFLNASDPNGIVAEAFGVKSMPSSFILDGSGSVVLAHRGFRESDKKLLRDEINRLLAESGQVAANR